MPKEDLLLRVRECVDTAEMLQNGDKALVAVSGGPDSVCLLEVLCLLRQPLSIELALVHYNHKTRGEDSDADAVFVRRLASEKNLPFYEGSFPGDKFVQPKGKSFQEAARDMRYGFFTEVACREGFQVLATGHNADDHAETVLMRLLAGSGPEGLLGIPEKNRFRLRDGDNVLTVIRPLLCLWRSDILDFLKAQGISYRTDPSNLEPKYFRNKLRLELIPLIEREVNPQLREHLVRLAATLRRSEKYLRDVAVSWLESNAARSSDELVLPRDSLRKLPKTLRLKVLQRAAELFASNDKEMRGPSWLGMKELAELDDLVCAVSTGKVFVCSNGARVITEYDTALFCRELDKPREEWEEALPVPGEISLTTIGATVRAEIVPKTHSIEQLKLLCSPQRQYFSATKIAGQLRIRYRRPGDAFYPLGAGGVQSLKEFFIDHKVPPLIRDSTPLIFCGDDLIWVVGFRPDERYKVGEETTEMLCVTVEKASRRVTND